jgi:hypothetical protein
LFPKFQEAAAFFCPLPAFSQQASADAVEEAPALIALVAVAEPA